MNKRSLWQEFQFMLVLSFICTLLLSGTKLAIGDRTDFTSNSIKIILDILGEKTTKDFYEYFSKKYNQISKGKIKVWQNVTNPTIFACEATGIGMWSEIKILFVVDKEKNQILGLKVTEQKETAGIGSKISEEEFTKQFTNMQLQKQTKVDAITGATISSKSVEKLLNKALSKFYF